ncbi:MAG: acetyl-CoA carboxylase biotin carboxyl carrier protein [Candidatus Electryonea clarkiae]|nr:acetyl-CoA carboxylase biotin carboxyl carrier protein [Candidatus Electryonea clarkiae]MDP8288892.1 acetyl-CoA carboxylase biotin carboxyl carrier protein [Candidatus Electryonea clarkiae]
MDWSEVRKLVKLVERSDIQEIELEREGTRIRICKATPAAANSPVVYSQPQVQYPGIVYPAPVSHQTVESEIPQESSAPSKNYSELKSPMVGTYYSSPAPDAEAYVRVGDWVQAGQTLCIVEAMKLMNEIESDIGGRIVEILCDNETPVEFGQVLFLIDPKG